MCKLFDILRIDLFTTFCITNIFLIIYLSKTGSGRKPFDFNWIIQDSQIRTLRLQVCGFFTSPQKKFPRIISRVGSNQLRLENKFIDEDHNV